jgi:D-lactate dehydrogenase (cytochrome)
MNRMRNVLRWDSDSVQVKGGLTLSEFEVELRTRALYYPPAPTYDGATIAGTASTNAAGAATYRYGTTRAWIRAMTVVLACGEVLDLRRGEVFAAADGQFELELSDGRAVDIPVPVYRMPDVPKRSAGYYAAPSMDLIDLFIGSEGTLGVIVDVELRVMSPRPGWLALLVPVADDAAATPRS